VKTVNRSAIGLWLGAWGLGLAVLSITLGAQDRFAEIYARGAAKQKTMHSLQARFTETTTSSLLTRPIVARGTITAAMPVRVRMTYTEPEQKVLTMDGRTMTIAWPARNERQQINIADIQKRVDHYFTSASIKELRSMFEITARTDAADRDVIDMRPTRKQIKEGLEHLMLAIDRRTDMLAEMRLDFPGGEQKTIALSDVVVNVPVSDDLFKQ